MRKFWTAGALAGLCAIAACSASPAVPHAGEPSSRASTSGHASASSARSASPAPAGPDTPTRPGPAQAASASPAAPPAPRITLTRSRTPDGSVVTVAIIRGPVRYVLHNGSLDPGAAAAGRVRAGPVVTGAERRQLLAAFNGGFKLSAGVGGYEQEGHVISPLRRGLASLVIDSAGQATIGIWGRGVPAPGEAVYSVRQNLPPLVLNGQPTPAAADWSQWGATIGGEYVARSALGQNAAGDLLYAASMSTTPADLATVLAYDGARIAMELDINPEWVQLDVAGRPGGSLRTAVPGQYRPADQYLVGWTRDFVAVLAFPAPVQPPTARLRP
jgi:Phosphodiester glycosidase